MTGRNNFKQTKRDTVTQTSRTVPSSPILSQSSEFSQELRAARGESFPPGRRGGTIPLVPPTSRETPPQELRFCRSADGTRIAWARHGSGPPLVIATCWLSHLQHDWQSPVWRHFLAALGEIATVVRYDERGHGLSDWDVEDFGLEARIADLEAVVDDAGFDRFALLAMSQGRPPSIAYASRHPERVSRMVFYGSYEAALRAPASPAMLMDEA